MLSSMDQRSSKRRRRKPVQAYQAAPHSNEEEKLLQQAIANSRLDRHRPPDGWLSVPAGPTFSPTVEEFAGNPVHYINKIRPIAEKYGICKIVPPAGWDPPFCVNMDSPKKFQTKEQLIHRLQEGISFGDGEDYTAKEYQKMASKQAMKWRETNYPDHFDPKEKGENQTDTNLTASNLPNGMQELEENSAKPESHNVPNLDQDSDNDRRMTPENLERDYWDIVETHSRNLAVEYGNDVDTTEFGSGFPLSERGRSIGGKIDPAKVDKPEPEFGTDDFYKETWWNLNNIPSCPDSILRHVKVGINGINVPWLYFGTLFSTFCWHNEDNYLYSINYHHKGAPKQWYGVPGTPEAADGVEKVFKNYLSMKMREEPDLLHHITTMFSPRLLQQSEVPVYKILQYAGEFVVTFPRAFHGGFSLGPNCGEAVNFATHDWIHHGADACERYRSFARPAVFSHDRLTFTMANHLAEQKTNDTCQLLVAELERVIEEELRLRSKLIQSGVRDVSGDIKLPMNRLDQLDEKSADYDDKRLCHACKHVCFFSAVACECSQSKVSCLRHSHYMCRCPTERKYIMMWSSEREMLTTLERVKRYSKKLEESLTALDNTQSALIEADTSSGTSKLAHGVLEDLQRHEDEEIDIRPIGVVESNKIVNVAAGTHIASVERKSLIESNVEKVEANLPPPVSSGEVQNNTKANMPPSVSSGEAQNGAQANLPPPVSSGEAQNNIQANLPPPVSSGEMQTTFSVDIAKASSDTDGTCSDTDSDVIIIDPPTSSQDRIQTCS